MLIQSQNFAQKSARVKQLDVLRAIAIFLVWEFVILSPEEIAMITKQDWQWLAAVSEY